MTSREFTAKDIELIQNEWESLREAAQRRCRSEQELAIVQKAFDFANFAHKNVRRMSGLPHITHPVAVAKIVATEIGLGYKSICAALLHDTLEYTEFGIDDIRNLFGDKISQLVDGLSKMKVVLDEDAMASFSSSDAESLQAENLKRILLSLGDDARVVLIKLADRLHNCRTIEYLPEIKRNRVLSETMFIFIPLAHRLGFYGIKSEMEDIWLKYNRPEEYKAIADRVDMDVEQRQKDITEFIGPIKEMLDGMEFRYEIKRRVKTPYSIWYKMQNKNVKFEEIYDLYAVRIIFEPTADDPETEKEDALKIHEELLKLYRNNPERERDWIHYPKANGYEALHCTLMSKAGIWMEVQIRSRRMDDIAEKGIAAHWAYKRNGYASENDTETDRWLAQINTILSSKEMGAAELLELLQNNLSSISITVFTPKGEQKSVPAGSTALDLAYHIHTELGNKAIACKVNSVLCPVSNELKAGDKVEIITVEKGHPKAEWLQFLKTRQAKKKVMDYLKSQEMI